MIDRKVKYGNVFALKEHMLKGKRISRLESILLFGVQNFTAVLSNIKKEILESGDARMIEALGLFPGESLIKLKKILNKITD